MNKKVILGATIGLMSFGMATQAMAAEGEYQTIEKDTSAKIQARGNLGKIDNTDPDTAIPEGSKDWINVTLPTSVVFYTAEKNGVVDDKITAPTNYKITNNSGRPVSINIASYEVTKNHDSLQSLNLEHVAGADFTNVPLVESGAAKGIIDQDLVDLASVQGELNGQGKENTTSFTFTGAVDVDKLPADKAAQVDSTLALKFTALKLDGTKVN